MSNQIYFDAMKAKGLADAADLQERSSSLDGTALYAEEDKIPDFAEAVKVRNMLERKAGQKDGFVCRSTAGRVVRLLQVYDSEIYLQEPEELPAQWGFVWSTSPYAKGDCCTAGGKTWRSKIDTNTWSPETNPEFWEEVKK